MARPADPHRREAILRAATEALTEQGFSDTRLADIAQRAGVSTSTLYLYFRSKEEMVRAITREKRQILFDQLGPVLARLKGEEDIVQFVEIVIAFAKENRDQIIIFNLDGGLNSGTRRKRHTKPRQRMEKGIEIIRDLIADGSLYPYDPELVMEMLVTTTRWIITRCVSIEEEDEESLKRFCVQWLSQALLRPPENAGT
jgi:AcrR family transcriptional regulator